MSASAFPAHAEIRGELFGFKSRALAETFRDQICGTLQRAGHPALRGALCLAERGQTCVVFKYLGRAIVWTDGLTFDELKTWLDVTHSSASSVVEAVRPGEYVPSLFEEAFARGSEKRLARWCGEKRPLAGTPVALIITDDLTTDAEPASWSADDLELWYGEKRTSAHQSRCPEQDAPRKRGHPQTVMQGSVTGRTDEWRTPQEIVDKSALASLSGITVDVTPAPGFALSWKGVQCYKRREQS